MTLQNTLRLADPDTARALRHHGAFLGLFVQPKSPSDVAQAAGMAANLAHHHARKLAALGLLREQRREGGRVYYQLSAREFRVPWSVMPPTDEQGGELAGLSSVISGFRQAYERSWLAAGTDEELVVGFSGFSDPAAPLPRPASRPAQSHPTHFDALTLRLSPARYRALAHAITALLDEAGLDAQPEGEVCTVAVLAYQGTVGGGRLGEGKFIGRLSRQTSSFLGVEPHQPLRRP